MRPLIALLLAIAAVVAGCANIYRPARIPMEQLRISGPCEQRASVLLVMLPGAYSRPTEFVDEGFVAALVARGLAADIAVVDAHVGYYNDNSVLRRLREDVVLPARQQGYAQVWLVGISIGGFGALGYGALHPGDIDGIVAIAPYLGRRTLVRQIAEAGGPSIWHGQVAASEEQEMEVALWRWLATPNHSPPVYLGFGRDDRFADAHRLLASILPTGRQFDTPGGHDWPAWRQVWEKWLSLGLLPTDCPTVKN